MGGTVLVATSQSLHWAASGPQYDVQGWSVAFCKNPTYSAAAVYLISDSPAGEEPTKIGFLAAEVEDPATALRTGGGGRRCGAAGRTMLTARMVYGDQSDTKQKKRK